MIWWFVGGCFFGVIVTVFVIGITSMSKDD